MRLDWHTLVLQAVNFAVLVWLLQRFLYRPVLRAVDGRRAEIDKQLADARKAQAEASERLAAANAERSEVLKAAAAEAERAAAARHAAAEREAAALLDEVRKSLAAERREALAEARQAALDLAAALARRLLEELPERLRGEAWLERVAESLAQLPAERRAALIGQLSPASPLAVTTAAALSDDALESWRRRLAGALGGCPVTFRVDPALGAGVELGFPAANLRFSLQSATEALRAELERASRRALEASSTAAAS
jgi:F-type H+-transporting ATPase subunit b